MKEKFYWGKQVRPTLYSIERGINKREDEGICLGLNYTGSVLVVKKGRKAPRPYSKDFWI